MNKKDKNNKNEEIKNNHDDEKNIQEELNEDIKEIEEMKNQLKEVEDKAERYLDKFKRTMAEFDNFRKRTQKEKTKMYTDGVVETLVKILPVVDNFERALDHETSDKEYSDGIELVYKNFIDILEKMGVEEIKCEKFDPEYHNAVMHVEDDNFGENEIIEVMQKGYVYNERVIRHSMVKVAN